LPSLYIDVSKGMGGDMFLAGLAGLGLDLEPLSSIMSGLLRSIEAERIERAHLAGLRLKICELSPQPLRHLPDILKIIDKLDVSAAVKTKSAAAFQRLAGIEAEAHGTTVDKIHFHEVGAADTIVDVVGAFWGLETLGIGRVECSPLPWFSGSVECSHGRLPLPAPATLALMRGKPVRPTGLEGELLTPTGALILDQCADAFTQGPQGAITRHSLSFGQREGPGMRMILFEPEIEAERETVWVLESNIDHLTGEELGDCFERLFSAGSLDVIHLPGMMKKNRPGGLLQAICLPKDLDRVEEEFFRSTLTLGIRRSPVERRTLPRAGTEMNSPLGAIKAKQCLFKEKEYSSPEFEAIRELAAKTGRSPVELRRLLMREDSGE